MASESQSELLPAQAAAHLREHGLLKMDRQPLDLFVTPATSKVRSSFPLKGGFDRTRCQHNHKDKSCQSQQLWQEHEATCCEGHLQNIYTQARVKVAHDIKMGPRLNCNWGASYIVGCVEFAAEMAATRNWKSKVTLSFWRFAFGFFCYTVTRLLSPRNKVGQFVGLGIWMWRFGSEPQAPLPLPGF